MKRVVEAGEPEVIGNSSSVLESVSHDQHHDGSESDLQEAAVDYSAKRKEPIGFNEVIIIDFDSYFDLCNRTMRLFSSRLKLFPTARNVNHPQTLPRLKTRHVTVLVIHVNVIFVRTC